MTVFELELYMLSRGQRRREAESDDSDDMCACLYNRHSELTVRAGHEQRHRGRNVADTTAHNLCTLSHCMALHGV